MAGRRAAGLSLVSRPRLLVGDPTEQALAFLPSRLWLIGLGNLGQAFAWLFACLPYGDRSKVALLLQDFDRITPANESTSLLSFKTDVGRRKSRVVSEWLEARGFNTMLEERRFGDWTKRGPDEPGVALCGVDNAYAGTALEKPGFDLVIEAGLGAGPNAFRSISMQAFPASRTAEQIWSRDVGRTDSSIENMPAYQALKRDGMDSCGLTQLASPQVGVPFVGLIAATLVVAELFRRLHGGTADWNLHPARLRRSTISRRRSCPLHPTKVATSLQITIRRNNAAGKPPQQPHTASLKAIGRGSVSLSDL